MGFVKDSIIEGITKANKALFDRLGSGIEESTSKAEAALTTANTAQTTALAAQVAAGEASNTSRGVLLGAALNYQGLCENAYGAKYLETFLAHFDSWTPESELKFGTTYNSGTRTPPTAANVSKYAAMSLKVPTQKSRGHCFIWHIGNPEWLTNPLTAWTPTTLESQIEKAIKRVMTAAIAANPELDSFDVLNEVAADTGSGLRSTLYTTVFGSTAITTGSATMKFFANCFIWAKEAAVTAGKPSMKFFYNDYSIETDFNWKGESAETKEKGQTAKKVCEVLLELGAPLHGIGLQCHRHVDQAPLASELTTHIKAFQALHGGTFLAEITEADLNFRAESEREGRPEGSLATQAEGFAQMANATVACGLARLTLWGFVNLSSWLNVSGRESTLTSGARPLPFKTDYSETPSVGILAALRASATKGSSAIETLKAEMLAEFKKLWAAIEALGAVGPGPGGKTKLEEEEEAAAKKEVPPTPGTIHMGINGNASHYAMWLPNKVTWLRAASNWNLEAVYKASMNSGEEDAMIATVKAGVVGCLSENRTPIVLITPERLTKWNTIPGYAAFAFKLIQAIQKAHPAARYYELANEPYEITGGPSPKQYGERMKEVYEKVIAAGISLAPAPGGIYLAIAGHGEVNEPGVGFVKWLSVVGTAMGAMKAYVNAITSHPYGTASETAIEAENGNFAEVKKMRATAIAAGFLAQAYNCIWITEFGFEVNAGNTVKGPHVKTIKEAKEKYAEWWPVLLKAAEEGWLFLIMPYNQEGGEGWALSSGGTLNEAGVEYAHFALSNG